MACRGRVQRHLVAAIFLSAFMATCSALAQAQTDASSASADASAKKSPTAEAAAPLPRICVPPPMLKMVETSQSANTSEAVRNALVAYMSGPTVNVIPLESRIMVHIETEARSKNCDLVAYSTLTLLKSGGTANLGSMLKKVAPVAALISLTGSRTTSMAATAVRVAAEVMGEVTVDRKKKDKVVFEYKLMPVGAAAPILADTQKARSEEDSEDILSPMLAKHAEVMVIATLHYYNVEMARKKQLQQQQQPNGATPARSEDQTAQLKQGADASPKQQQPAEQKADQ